MMSSQIPTLARGGGGGVGVSIDKCISGEAVSMRREGLLHIRYFEN